MKLASYSVAAYALLVFLGGFIAFVKAGSLVSIGMASLFAALLFACAFFMMKHKRAPFFGALALIVILLVFFGQKFMVKQTFLPSGLMTLASILELAFLGYLWYKCPKTRCDKGCK